MPRAAKFRVSFRYVPSIKTPTPCLSVHKHIALHDQRPNLTDFSRDTAQILICCMQVHTRTPHLRSFTATTRLTTSSSQPHPDLPVLHFLRTISQDKCTAQLKSRNCQDSPIYGVTFQHGVSHLAKISIKQICLVMKGTRIYSNRKACSDNHPAECITVFTIPSGEITSLDARFRSRYDSV